jgi:hypothetical protein
MDEKEKVKDLLSQKFDPKKIDSMITYFFSCLQRIEEGDWENCLIKAGKFIEIIIKLLWTYSGKSLPARMRDFKAGAYAEKIIKEVDRKTVPEDEIRVQIPRASIFIYDVSSNRGARHDPEEVNPNEMDASVVMLLCSWILAELVRFSAKESINVDEAKKIVDSLMERRFPVFEDIDGRIYVDNKKFKSAPECTLLLLYKLYPKRIAKKKLVELVKKHGFKQTAVKLERLAKYMDDDGSGNLLLRATGKREAEKILNKK